MNEQVGFVKPANQSTNLVRNLIIDNHLTVNDLVTPAAKKQFSEIFHQLNSEWGFLDRLDDAIYDQIYEQIEQN